MKFSAEHNWYAISSLIFSLMGFFLPPIALIAHYSPFNVLQNSLQFVVSMLGPSLLGIIFGHIGHVHAKTIPGRSDGDQTALAGLIVGYIFVSVYALVLLLLLLIKFRPNI